MAWREHLTLLHLPTTSVLLSLGVLGSLLAPQIHVDRLLLFLPQVFLGGSVAANHLDELVDRPWHTKIPRSRLWIVAIVSLSSFVAIGLYLATKVACNFIFFVIIESFIIVAYDLELFGGIFHNANSLGTSWGLVFLAGYYLQDQDLSALILAISFMVYLCSMQGIELYEKGKSYGRDRNHQDANAKLAWKTLRMGILAVDGITLVLVTYRLFLI